MLPIKHFSAFHDLHFHRKLGIIADLMLLSRRFTNNLQKEIEHLIPAIWLGQIDLYYNRHNTVCAISAWARVSETVDVYLKTNPIGMLDESEWNEGSILWIIRFFSIPDAACGSFRAARNCMLQREGHFTYRRFPAGRGCQRAITISSA